MRRHALRFPLLLACSVLLAPFAAANEAKPASGFVFEMDLGDQAAVSIVGTQGCTFEVGASSSNTGVAQVTARVGARKIHKVIIEAVGAGTADISISTFGGSIPNCEGFAFFYEVVVAADGKAFLKQAAAKLKAATKDIKAGLKDIELQFGQVVDDAVDAVKNGDLDIDDATDQAFDVGQDWVDFLDAELADFLDDVYEDVWGRAGEFGITELTPDLLELYDGGCGDWDKFVDGAHALVDRSVKVFTRELKVLTKASALAAAGVDDDFLFVFAQPDLAVEQDDPVPLPSAEPVELPPPPEKPLARTWTSAGRLSSSSVSKLHIGGTADPNGPPVTVDIVGPDGTTAQLDATVDENCHWRADFGSLPPGSYTVTLSQGSKGPVEFGTKVP